jgi:hypothetical protein
VGAEQDFRTQQFEQGFASYTAARFALRIIRVNQRQRLQQATQNIDLKITQDDFQIRNE